MLKENQISVAGRVGGLWNNETKKHEIRSGVTQNGKKYQIFEISVAKKVGENWTNGKGLKVMLWGDTTIEAGTQVGIVGRLQPDNFTTKDGIEVRGMMVNAFDGDMYVPAKWENSQTSTDAKVATANTTDAPQQQAAF
jgi:hypothetical protein